MILVDDKQAEALEARRLAEEQEHHLIEPPPAYALHPHSPSSSHSSSSTSSPTSPQPKPKPSNYISITRTHTNIKESYTIDPNLYIPNFLLPPLGKEETEETRRNLRLEAVHGVVSVKVRLLGVGEGEPEREGGGEQEGGEGDRGDGGRKRVTMSMKSDHGGISAKITGPPTRPPFHIHLKSSNGDIRLHIPRSFHGPISVSLKHGTLKFSESLSRSLTTFGEVNGLRTGFIGDFSAATSGRLAKGDKKGARGNGGNGKKDKGGWDGDEIFIEAKHGCVRVQFDGEEGGRSVVAKPSFLNRVFGF